MNDLQQWQQFRQQLDQQFKESRQSPLDKGQKRNFSGLSYYPYNEKLIFERQAERLSAELPAITLATSTGHEVSYQPWGTVRFNVGEDSAELLLLYDANSDSFFLPFKDATNGTASYGAGRYLDSHRLGLIFLGDDSFLIDFNYAYNPYCAYSSQYSCPLPPPANWLTIPIEAGELAYKQ